MLNYMRSLITWNQWKIEKCFSPKLDNNPPLRQAQNCTAGTWTLMEKKIYLLFPLDIYAIEERWKERGSLTDENNYV